MGTAPAAADEAEEGTGTASVKKPEGGQQRGGGPGSWLPEAGAARNRCLQLREEESRKQSLTSNYCFRLVGFLVCLFVVVFNHQLNIFWALFVLERTSLGVGA